MIATEPCFCVQFFFLFIEEFIMQFFIKNIFIFILFSYFTTNLFAASYSCSGQKVYPIHGATTNKSKSYSTNRSNKKYRYFKFKTGADGTVKVDYRHRNSIDYKLQVGSSCGGHDIYNGSLSGSDSTTFTVNAGTYYYVRVGSDTRQRLKFNIDFTFTVGSTNHNPTDISLSNNTIDENQASGTTIGNFSTTDADSGDTHTYSLVAGSGDTDNSSFIISGDTLKSNTVFDYETKSSYSIRVQTDDGNGGSYEKQFTISINNLTESDLKLTEISAPTPNPANTNEDITFKLRIKNDGPDHAQGNIVLKTSYNKDVTIISATQTAGGGDFSCSPTNGTLTAGSYITCTKTNQLNRNAVNKDIKIVVRSSTNGSLIQTATVESTTTSDPDTSNNTITSNVIVNIATYSTSTDDICYEPFEETGLNFGIGSFMSTTKMPIKNLNSSDLTNVKVALGTSSAFSAFSGCGVENGSGTCEDANGMSFMMFSAFNDGVNFNLEDLSQNETVTPYTKSLFSFFTSGNYDLVTEYTKDGVTHRGVVKACPVSYCETNNMSEGFHVVDPDNGNQDNSFEIFCHQDSDGVWHDLLALPIKNSSNNFVFNNDSTSSNYYSESANPRKHFHAIEIDGGHITYNGDKPLIPIVIGRSDEPWSIQTGGNSYKVMGKYFSNINLIGTPYTLDWDSSNNLKECDESKLRKALGQAVKYNTLVADNHSRCRIDTLNLSLLDDYRFLVYNNAEVLQHSCKEMASYIPNNVGVLNDADIAGHFNILTTEPAYPNAIPTSNGTRDNATDIGKKKRPLTVYCKYQTDLQYVWTFLTALDAEVTNSKNDITSGHDTCSQLGLYFFVPNTKETFDRVRRYLKGQKSGDQGWENYTGTVREKYKMYTNSPSKEYYLNKLGYEKIWPYGPLGIYYPCRGNRDANNNCNTRSWYPGNTAQKGWMSGAPMHNIKTMTNYNDSMGKKGFVSILGSQDLNKTDDWWVADIGAGEEIGYTTPKYSPHGTHLIQSSGYKYYEPNGNYTANAWLNFLHDSEGWIYHNDDNNAFYSYYDYMCMAETNYDSASRYTLIPGFFNAIERGTRTGNTAPSFSDTNITTKIVSKNMNLDAILYKINSDGTINRNQLNVDENKSVGVFVSKIIDATSPVPIQYLGSYSDFDSNNGRIELPSFNISSAHKRVIIQFYYCNTSNRDWTECWNFTTNNGAITLQKIDADGDVTDSVDDFAIRPKKFGIVLPSTNAVKAEDVAITYYAYDENNNPANNYNESFADLDFNTTLADSTKLTVCPNTSLDLSAEQFTDGIEINTTKISNVGIWNVQIKEQNGSEFANVDFDDTPDNDRYITPADVNLTVIPSYFDVAIPTNINSATTFTYISNDLDNMAIEFDLNITAKNSDGVTTPNYSTGCYANNINIDLNYSIITDAQNPASFSTTKILYKELTSNIEGNNTASDKILSLPKGTDTLPASLFTTTSKGKANVSLRINFERQKNIALNPFKVNFSDINVSDRTYTPVVTSNNTTHTIDKNATMLYGRTNAPRQRFVGNNGNELIYFESYCNTIDAHGTKCNKALLPAGNNSNYNDDPRWFINPLHKIAQGSVGTILQKGSSSHITTTSTVTDTSPAVVTLHYDGSKGYPYKGTMEHNASSWLIYDKYDATKTKNSFEVEFVNSSSNWAGEANTDTTTKNSAVSNTNRRLMW